jgi:hypothetical protein
VHPFFGLVREDQRFGTPLIFEVRGHDLPISLADNEVMAKLIFYRMSKDAEATEEDKSPYDAQELNLSALFRGWPDNLSRLENGCLQAAK